jgi:nitrogen fixation protein NifU and related proteins
MEQDQEREQGSLIDHAQRPRNNSPLSEFNGRARVTGPCGDTMEFWVQVRDGVVEGVSFATDGCGISHACGSMATCLVEGRPLIEAAALMPEAIVEAFNGLPADHEHCALLSANALKAACENSSEVLSLCTGGPESPDSVVRVAAAVAVGRLSPNVDHGESFALLDVDSRTMQVLQRQNLPAPPQEVELLPQWLSESGAQVLICGDMEARAQESFAAQGIHVVVDAVQDIPEALIADYVGGSFAV